MAVFYLMPPRNLVGKQLSESLGRLFPGLAWKPKAWNDLAEALGAAVGSQGDAFVVFREDLPDQEEDLKLALQQYFGAEEDDEVVVIHPDSSVSGEFVRRVTPSAN